MGKEIKHFHILPIRKTVTRYLSYKNGLFTLLEISKFLHIKQNKYIFGRWRVRIIYRERENENFERKKCNECEQT